METMGLTIKDFNQQSEMITKEREHFEHNLNYEFETFNTKISNTKSELLELLQFKEEEFLALAKSNKESFLEDYDNKKEEAFLFLKQNINQSLKKVTDTITGLNEDAKIEIETLLSQTQIDLTSKINEMKVIDERIASQIIDAHSKTDEIEEAIVQFDNKLEELSLEKQGDFLAVLKSRSADPT